MTRTPGDPGLRETPPRSIRVAVQLFANLVDYAPGGVGGAPFDTVVPSGATAAELVRRLGIPDGLPCLVLVNGRDAAAGRPLRPGDTVSVLPPLVGG